MWSSLARAGCVLGDADGPQRSPGDVEAGRCAKAAAQGCGNKSLLLQAREGEEVSPRQSARA